MTQRKPKITAAEPGNFTDWRDFEPGSDLLFYEGLHGCDGHRNGRSSPAMRI